MTAGVDFAVAAIVFTLRFMGVLKGTPVVVFAAGFYRWVGKSRHACASRHHWVLAVFGV